jgi:N-acetylneuraminate lyase
LNRFGGAVAGKALMKMIGLDCGPARLPQRTLSSDDSDALRNELKKMIETRTLTALDSNL